MDSSADVRSISGLREWIASLAKYKSSATESLSGIEMEIRRASDWLEEQVQLWQRAVKQCEEDVVQARNELAARKWPGPSDRPPDTTVQERNLRRAHSRLEQAEEMVQKCRSWLVKLPKLVDETYTGSARRLGLFLESDLVKGMAGLERRVESLEAYAQTRPDFAPLKSVLISSEPPPAAADKKSPQSPNT